MERLASSLLEYDWSDFSEESIKSAKLVLLDTLGALVTGMQQEESLKLAIQFANNGDYRILGTSYHTDLHSAGLVHGVATVSTEMDEGNQYSKGHPAAHVVPVLMTMLQNRQDISGKRLLEILIKGYEACSRFGRATTLLPEAHAHGTWGVLGAAATALLIEDVSHREFCEGVGLSATFALPTLWTAALDGKLIRNIYGGHAIEMGIKSVAFLKSNHLAPENNISYVFSSVIGQNFNEDELVRDVNDPWDIELNYFKPYAFCRYVHAPIDAFKAIIDTHKLSAQQIERINVYTYSRAATLSNQSYHNVLSSKFSIPFAISVMLHKQKANQSVFIESLHKNQEMKKFAEKVYVYNSEDLEKDYPKVMPALVEVIDKDGKIYSERIDIAKGGPGKKLTEQEIIKKFNDLTSTVYSKEKQNEIIHFIMNLEEKEDVSHLFQLLMMEKGDF
jgi:2-methylcitrate dehydratase PrpD